MNSEALYFTDFGHKNYIFIGEPGSGKSEIALNYALAVAGSHLGKVHFYDLDQTKPILRSRDREWILGEKGIVLHYQEQFLDSPAVAVGFRECLMDAEKITVTDVAGGRAGVKAIAQFAQCIRDTDTQCFFVLNCFRPWSGDVESVRSSLETVEEYLGLTKISIIANPCLGETTTEKELQEGMEKTLKMVDGEYEIKAFAVEKKLVNDCIFKFRIPVFELESQMKWDTGL